MRKDKYLPAEKVAELKIADFVRLTCELKEITQAELARRAGIHPPHLSEIVHGKRAIGAAVARRLAKVIGISVSRLLEDELEETKRKVVEDTLKRMKRHVKASESLGEETERILLEDIEEALEANRAAS